MPRFMQIFFFIIIFIIIQSTSYSFSITYFSSAAYNTNVATMNATLGITSDYVVEDFEDNTFVSGLNITYSFHNIFPHSFNTSTTLSWDGTRNLNVVGGNYPGTNGGTTLTFDNKASSVGIGFGGIDNAGWALYVNGILLTSDFAAGFTKGSGIRVVYLRIDAGLGESIDNIYFQRSANGDYIYVDHIAFAPLATATPEPTTFLSIIIGFGVWLFQKSKKIS